MDRNAALIGDESDDSQRVAAADVHGVPPAGAGAAASPGTTVLLPLTLLRTDGGTQTRARLDPSTVEDYAAAMREGAQFPPLTVFYDGTNYWLADGFHRAAGAEKAGRNEFAIQVRQGTQRDAILCSCSANATHGLRRSNADKERAVQTLLGDEEWRAWSNSELARRCSVDPKTVGSVRHAMEVSGEIPTSTTRMVKRGGTTFPVDTSGISTANADRADLSAEHRARGWRLVRAEQDGQPIYWAERPGARWPAPTAAGSLSELEHDLDAVVTGERNFDPTADPTQRPWPLTRSVDHPALPAELLARGWSLFQNAAVATWWMQTSPHARMSRSAWRGWATPAVTSAEEAIEDARAMESLERHGWSLQGTPGAWWACEGNWYGRALSSPYLKRTVEYASWSAVAAAVRAQEREGKAPRTPPVRETAVLAPHVLWAGDQPGAYELPPIERLAVRYHTVRDDAITTVRCAQEDGAELSRPPDQVWRLLDDEAWARTQQLYRDFQFALTALAAQLSGLGTYAEKLRAAGGVKKAPEYLCPTVIAAEEPGVIRTMWFNRWRVPSVVRRTITRHTPEMLEYDSSSGYYAQRVSQSGHFVCPDDVAWRQVESCYRRAIAAQEAWDALLREALTYAQAFAQVAGGTESSVGSVREPDLEDRATVGEEMQLPTADVLSSLLVPDELGEASQEAPSTVADVGSARVKDSVGYSARQGASPAGVEHAVEQRLGELLEHADEGLVLAILLLLGGTEVLEDLADAPETSPASVAALLVAYGWVNAEGDDWVKAAIFAALDLSADDAPPDGASGSEVQPAAVMN